MKLTDKTAAALTLPAGKLEHFEWCETTPGFGVRLRKTGDEIARRWYIQFRVGKQQRRESLGDVRKVKAEDARTIARNRFAKVELGQDPTADKAAAKAEALKLTRTLGKTVEQYLAAVERDLRPSSYAASVRYLRKHFEPLHSMPIDSIKRADIASRLEDLKAEHGIVAAARARSVLSALFAWSIAMGLAENNPVAGTLIPDKGNEPRERTLSDDELKIIWANLQDDTFGQVVKLLTLTGCRRGEIGDLQWSEIDLQTGVMTLPPERTKNGDGLVLTLPPSAQAILKAIPRNQFRGDFVFGKRGQKGFNAWSYCTLALNARITASGNTLEPWTLHDIRRSVRTGLGRIGIPPHIAERVIGHLPPKLQRTYDRHDYSGDIKSALLRWADHVEAIIEGRTSNVIDIKHAAN
ncbi:site-specific integrase [Bradyrhizobium sp. 157]|uniref:tyrosine-type recombinase/integrase n=1 Tax=Bradyrhizobium sp. 157 TaxID=2782631 RepID=UPI001FF94C77|nr:tyrosine-type recombinase/integrase [Bradyrhizobium sp. 157]MCK1639094.1 site-specific integrase [Bradyrhizobium sp. 157]